MQTHSIRPQLIALRSLVPRRIPRRRLIMPDLQVEGWMNMALRHRWNRHFGKATK